MTKVELFAPEPHGSSLLTHLRTGIEQVVFARAVTTDRRLSYEITELLTVDEDDVDFHSGEAHVSLSDAARARFFTWAALSGGIIVEAHSHGRYGDPATFSRTDLEGLAAWVPHVQWRLKHRPYVALVVGHDTMDGLAWVEHGLTAVGTLTTEQERLVATSRSIKRLRSAND